MFICISGFQDKMTERMMILNSEHNLQKLVDFFEEQDGESETANILFSRIFMLALNFCELKMYYENYKFFNMKKTYNALQADEEIYDYSELLKIVSEFDNLVLKTCQDYASSISSSIIISSQSYLKNSLE